MFDSGKSERICLEYLPPARTNIPRADLFPFYWLIMTDRKMLKKKKKKPSGVSAVEIRKARIFLDPCDQRTDC